MRGRAERSRACLFLVLLAVGRWAHAQVQPASDLLLPYFETGLTGGDATTLFAVSNDLGKPVDVLAIVSTNWGVPVLSVPLRLQAHQIWTVDLRDWFASGKVPGDSLSAADLLHLQAALSGQPSPRDGLYYSTATSAGRAAGSIAIRTLGDRPQALQGQFFLVEPGQGSSQAEDLANVSAAAAPVEVCGQHTVVQIAGGAPGSSGVILWMDTGGQALPSPTPQDRRLPVTVSAYSAAGTLLKRQTVRLLPAARISVADLGLSQRLGRLELATGSGSVVALLAAGSTAFTTSCAQAPPPPPNQPRITISTLVNGQDASSPPGPTLPAGSPVVWTYVVRNAGVGNLNRVAVVDTPAGAVRCPLRQLRPGQSMTCSRSGVAGSCQQRNVGTATAVGPRQIPVSAQDAANYTGGDGSEIAIVVSTNGQDANAAPGPTVQAGSPVSWIYQVTNTGTVRLTQISVQDDHGVPVSCPGSSLLPGALMTCTASGVAVAGQYANVGSVTATGTCGQVTASDPSHYFAESSLGLTLQALTNGFDANFPPGPSIPVGNPVTWQYVVTNTGKLTVSNAGVTDDHGVAVSCPGSVLQPGESMTCIARGVATACQYTNFATASGQTSAGPVSASDPSSYFGQSQAALDIRTYANGQAADQLPGPTVATGSPLQWTYVVTNTGQVALSAIQVSDDRGGAVSCPQSGLQPGQAMTCTAAGTAAAGSYVSRGVASGQPSCGAAVSASDTASYVGSGDPGIRLQALVNQQDANTPPGPAIAVGGAIAWSYVVTNTGQLPLSHVAVSDSLGNFIICPQAALQPGAAMTCTSQGTAQACQSNDLGTATAQTAGGQTITAIDPAYYLGQVQASLQIQTTTNGVRAGAAPGPTILVGSAVTWTYAVVNTGNAPLTQVQVSDDQGAAVSCPATTLAPGESMRCTARGTAVEGQYHNVGSVTGTPPCGAQVSAADPGFYLGGGDGGIQLQKLTAGARTLEAPGPTIPLGAPVTWTYRVTNSGRVSLSGVGVTDNRGVAVTCPQSTLQPAESMSCLGTGTAQACQYDNLGTATGQTAAGQRVTAIDQGFYFGQIAASVTLQMSVNGQGAPTAPGPTIPVGSMVAWSYLVTNTGNVPLTAVRISDGHGAVVTCPNTSLQPGEAVTCNALGTAVAGQFDDTAGVTATPPCGAPVTASNSGHYFGQGTPGLRIQTFLNGQESPQPPGLSLAVGTPILWSYTVTNLGQVSLSGLAVTGPGTLQVSCERTTLQPGEATSCTTQSLDAAQACQQIISGKATTAQITAFGQSFYVGQFNASLQMQVTLNGVRATAAPGPTLAVGASLTWSYLATNLGTVKLSNVKVLDNQGAAVSCPASTLAPGQSMTCTATGKAVAGQFHTIGSVTADPPCGSQVSAQDSSFYFGQTAQIQVVKLLNGQHVTSSVGAPVLPLDSLIAWSYVVSNPGSVPLQLLSVVDDQGVSVHCPNQVTLQPGDYVVCTGSSRSQACPYKNVATAAGVAPGGLPVTDTDASYYSGQFQAAVQIATAVNGNPANTPPGIPLPLGFPVHWTYTVTNSGTVALSALQVTDDHGVTVSCPQSTLQPGGTMTCTANAITVSGLYHNVGSVTGLTPCGAQVSASDSSYYNVPQFIFESTTNFMPIWDDKGSNAILQGSFYRPVPPTGFFILGDYGTSGYTLPSGARVPTVQVAFDDPQSPALVPPADYQLVWDNSYYVPGIPSPFPGSSTRGSVWSPVPPPGPLGYVCSGFVFQGDWNKPNPANPAASPYLDKLRCVRSDLVTPIDLSGLVWDDQGASFPIAPIFVYQIPRVDIVYVIFVNPPTVKAFIPVGLP